MNKEEYTFYKNQVLSNTNKKTYVFHDKRKLHNFIEQFRTECPMARYYTLPDNTYIVIYNEESKHLLLNHLEDCITTKGQTLIKYLQLKNEIKNDIFE